MWAEIVCGGLIFLSIIWSLIKLCFDNDDAVLETYDSKVVNRLEKIYGGNAYLGLRIPDAGSRQDIDMVLLTKKEVMVISVLNISGSVYVKEDGSLVLEGSSIHRAEKDLSPLAETKQQASVLKSYLEQRGVTDLPEVSFPCRVVLPNPKLSIYYSSKFRREDFITYDQLKPGWITDVFRRIKKKMKGNFSGAKKKTQESIHKELEFILSKAPIRDSIHYSSKFRREDFITYDQLKPGWIKDVFRRINKKMKGSFSGAKKKIQESIHKKLEFILSKAPIRNRLELKGNKYVLGEFREFKGNQEDIQALRNFRRKKVTRLITQKKMNVFKGKEFGYYTTSAYLMDRIEALSFVLSSGLSKGRGFRFCHSDGKKVTVKIKH